MSELTAVQRRHEAVVNRHLEAENQHDIEATIATFDHPRYELNGVTHDGANAVREMHKTLNQALPDLRVTTGPLRHTDDAVIVEARGIGTHDGYWNGIAPTGWRVEFSGAGIFEFEGDRLVCEKVFFDTATVLTQMGVLPAGQTGPIDSGPGSAKILGAGIGGVPITSLESD
jgi:predicted ester cyclase